MFITFSIQYYKKGATIFMIKKTTWNDYIVNAVSKYKDTRKISPSLFEFLKNAYEETDINVAPYFNINNDTSEANIMYEVNAQIPLRFKFTIHNVGKNPWKRFWRSKKTKTPSWLKTESYILRMAYYRAKKSIVKSKPYLDFITPSNKTMAIARGFINENETDKDLIDKACRKIGDDLDTLKNKRKTITVEQKYNHNKRGSYHRIRVNWLRIIYLYQQYDENAEGSIRFRKSIRYRIVSFIKKAADKTKECKALISKQTSKYLKGLIKLKDPESFRINKFAVFKFLKEMSHLALRSNHFTTDYIIPQVEGRHITLIVKDPYVYDELIARDSVKSVFKSKYNHECTIKPMF